MADKDKLPTKPQRKKKEEIVKGMKKNKREFVDKYGKDAEKVMYATASKLTKEELRSRIKEQLNQILSEYEKKRVKR